MNAVNYGDAYTLDKLGRWFYAWGGLVPDAVTYFDLETDTVHCIAPELTPPFMMTISSIALTLGVKNSTVSRMLNRGDLPTPQYRWDRFCLWSSPVINHWLESRPGKGAHLKKGAV